MPSIKATQTDHAGRPVRTLTTENGPPLRQEDLERLLAGEAPEPGDLLAYLKQSALTPDAPPAGPEALLHAALPAAHVAFTWPDAVLGLACTPRAEAHIQAAYDGRAAFLPYAPPGLALARRVHALDVDALDCIIVGKLGLIAWGESAEACEEAVRRAVARAEAYADAKSKTAPLPGRQAVRPTSDGTSRQKMRAVLLALRGALGGILVHDQSAAALDAASRAAELGRQSAPSPAHLAHTGGLPLTIDPPFDAVARSIDDYTKKHSASPRVVLLPGLGIVTTGADFAAAQQAQRHYHSALNVMANSAALGGYEGLAPEEAAAPPTPPTPGGDLDGKVALVTGAANGIGLAAANRLAAEGAHVLIADIDRENGQAAAERICARHGEGRATFVYTDVTEEAAVIHAVALAVLTYGGLDVLVNNAGMALAAPIEETTLAMWRRCSDILGLGYFLMAREAVKAMKAQGTGGALVFVGSKNSIGPAPNATAYAAAKGSELQLARSLAEEVGAHQIRVNSVLPDAVIRGSRLWDNPQWTDERAAAHGVPLDELEDFYIQRTTLKVPIYPEDVAEAIAFFAGPRSAKTTGGVITVDGGVAIAYVR